MVRCSLQSKQTVESAMSVTKLSAFYIFSDKADTLLIRYFDDLIPKEKREAMQTELMTTMIDTPTRLVFTYHDYIVVFRKVGEDVFFAAIADESANEAYLDELLETLASVLYVLYKQHSFNDIMKQVNYLFLLIDEAINESGYVLEGNPSVLYSRVQLLDQEDQTNRNFELTGSGF